eukprot:923620-Rhodomonas_salina.3
MLNPSSSPLIPPVGILIPMLNGKRTERACALCICAVSLNSSTCVASSHSALPTTPPVTLSSTSPDEFMPWNPGRERVNPSPASRSISGVKLSAGTNASCTVSVNDPTGCTLASGDAATAPAAASAVTVIPLPPLPRTPTPGSMIPARGGTRTVTCASAATSSRKLPALKLRAEKPGSPSISCSPAAICIPGLKDTVMLATSPPTGAANDKTGPSLKYPTAAEVVTGTASGADWNPTLTKRSGLLRGFPYDGMVIPAEAGITTLTGWFAVSACPVSKSNDGISAYPLALYSSQISLLSHRLVKPGMPVTVPLPSDR